MQNRYRRPGTVIENILQTNGTLLNDQWGRFLRDNRFLVGLIIDGPCAVHDICRRDRQGRPTNGRVIRAARSLREHRVRFNTLMVTHRESAQHPLQVYRFLRDSYGDMGHNPPGPRPSPVLQPYRPMDGPRGQGGPNRNERREHHAAELRSWKPGIGHTTITSRLALRAGRCQQIRWMRKNIAPLRPTDNISGAQEQ